MQALAQLAKVTGEIFLQITIVGATVLLVHGDDSDAGTVVTAVAHFDLTFDDGAGGHLKFQREHLPRRVDLAAHQQHAAAADVLQQRFHRGRAIGDFALGG